MADTKIEWANKVWNPVTGCTKISPGCAHCYAERMAKRLAGRYGYPADDPFEVTLHPDKLDEPLRWRKPARIFVCSMGDLFHDDVPDEFIIRVLGIAWYSYLYNFGHTFLLLTKRPERMRDIFKSKKYANTANSYHIPRNVWLGATAENQDQADRRIPILLQIPAAVRFVSVEPMLGPVDLTNIKDKDGDTFNVLDRCAYATATDGEYHDIPNGLDWVICGGESGPGARPMHPDWARSLRNQCQAAGVPFLFKQWGDGCRMGTAFADNPYTMAGFDYRMKKGGRKLDGRFWDQYPEVRP